MVACGFSILLGEGYFFKYPSCNSSMTKKTQAETQIFALCTIDLTWCKTLIHHRGKIKCSFVYHCQFHIFCFQFLLFSISYWPSRPRPQKSGHYFHTSCFQLSYHAYNEAWWITKFERLVCYSWVSHYLCPLNWIDETAVLKQKFMYWKILSPFYESFWLFACVFAIGNL